MYFMNTPVNFYFIIYSTKKRCEMKAWLLTLLLCFSCTKYADLNRDDINLRIAPVDMEISQLNNVEWKVGERKEAEVSQSFTFTVQLPKLKTEDLEYLTENKGIDAWILRVIAMRGPEKMDLGSLYALFRPKQATRGVKATASSVSIKVYYAAAYPSQRFRSFKCPAFGHDKKISSMEILGKNEEFAIEIGNPVSYREKSQQVELTPSSFNGGHSLVGEYFVEIATYDSKNKKILSPFKRLPMYVKVFNEESINIKSCAGVRPEINH